MEKKKVLLTDAALTVAVLLMGVTSKLLLFYLDLPGCLLLTKKGIPCPACGGTRCVYSLFKGSFYSSFKFNPYFFLLIIYLLILFIVFNIRYLTDINFFKKIHKVMCDYRVIIGWALICPVFWVLRLIFGI